MKKYLFGCLIFILLIPSFLIAQEGLPNLIGIANVSNSGNSSDDRELRLNPPQNLQAVVTGNDVALTWDPPENPLLNRDLIKYNLYRNHNIIAVVYYPTTYFNDNNLDNGVYVYYVTAVYDEGESDPSNTVSVVLGDNPSAMIPDIPAHSATDISIPLTVNGLINFFAMNIAIEFDSSVIDSADATLIGGILENENYDLEVDTSVDGVIGLQFNANADWFTGNGVVAYLEFYVVGSSDDSTPLTFTQFDVNEVSFLDDVTNGSVNIWENPSAILPDTLTSPDTDISIPLTVSSLINLSEMDIIIEFDDNVIGSPAATLIGGILENENYDLNIDTSVDGVVELVFIANEDLFTGSGIVAYLGFTVFGICGDSTSLIFTQYDVNGINYLTDVVNGSVRIPFPSPQNFQAVVSGNDVLLSWEPPEPIPTSDLLMYKVYRNDCLIAVIYIPTTSFTDIGLENGTYNYYVTAVYEDGESDPSNLVEVTIPCVGVNEEVTDPQPILLKQNYPNPFSTSTTISFFNTNPTKTTKIRIYNVKGQLVKNFEFRSTSWQTNSELIKVVWDGRDENGKELSNGIYFYKMDTDDRTFIKKMILIR